MTDANRASSKAFRDLVWRCNPGPQREVLFGALGRVFEIMWGGAKGGGKSAVIGPKALLHIQEHPQHARVLILREDYGQLADLMDKMEPQCLAAGGVFNAAKNTWTFPEGAKIRFGHLTKGVRIYWGQEYTLIIVDEVTRCIKSKKDYLLLRSSLRNGHGIKGQIIVLTNPGGPGHNWVKAYFKGAPPLVIQRDKKGFERVFIPANLSDNPHLPPEYRDELNELPDAEREAYVEGNWDAFEGRVFKLVTGVHTWTWQQFRERTGETGIPKHWRRYRSYDHGFEAPGACYWYAMDEHGRAYVYREYYTVALDSKGEVVPNQGLRMEPQRVAVQVASRSYGETYTASWSGKDLFDKARGDDRGDGVTKASHFQAEGINFQAWAVGEGSRVAGKQALHQRMYYSKHPDGSPSAWPMIVFITEECPHAIRTLPALDRHPTQVESVDDSGEDHAFDSLGGFARMRPLESKAKPVASGAEWHENNTAQSSSRVG